jgi:c-di-GMP-binding flagellar brake protein YcgR
MDLTVLNTVRPGDKLEIHYINKLNQDLILDTVVYDVISDDEILIHNPLSQGKLYMIPLNITVTVFLKRADIGVIAFDILLLKRKKVGNVYTIASKVTSNIQKQQRRHFFRVKVYHDIDIYFMEDGDGHPVDYYIFDPDAVEENQVDLKASILDLSGGGVGLKTRLPIPCGTYVYAFLTFLSKKMEVQGKVVRSVESKKYPGDYEIGIEFRDVPKDIVRKITSYVFSAQQKARRKERD